MNAPDSADVAPQTASTSGTQAARGPARLPIVLALTALYWIVVQTAQAVAPGSFVHFMSTFWGPIGLAVALLVWWLGFSRLPWQERVADSALTLLGAAAVFPLVDKSMKLGVLLIATPAALSAAVVWMCVARRQTSRKRIVGLAVVQFAAWGAFTLLRVDGIGGDLRAELRWRWSETAEERFLAERAAPTARAAPAATTVGPLAASAGDWPEFRGPRRDSRVPDQRIATDWDRTPPRLVWKHRVGPGWSSFAVVGEYGFTQEQRGDDEAVVCYRLSDGVEIWSHLDRGRFWETVAGAGPRATPTFHDGKLYAFGAEGLLNCLDAASGRRLWQRNVREETGAATPIWGFAASPLIVPPAGGGETSGGEAVVVCVGGAEEAGNTKPGTVAYRASDGEPLWKGGTCAHTYASVQRAAIAERELLLTAHGEGLDAFTTDGKPAWNYAWAPSGMSRIVQPYVFADGRLLLPTGYGEGSRMLQVRREGDAWKLDEIWTSKKFNPYFNDYVVVDDFAYGFDGNIFCCLDLKTGERRWKRGRYGYGQVLLLAEQQLLLVLSDEGDAVLVQADPTELRELSRFKALEGKTWNHPVVVQGKLLVRNAEEAACYELRAAP